MNEDPRIKDLEVIKQVLDKFGVKFLVVYGALLGWYRDKGFLPGDDDIDLAILQEVDYKTRKDIGWALYNLGFGSQPITFNVFGRQEPVELGYNGDEKSGIIVCERNFKFTIFFFGKPEACDMHGEEIVCVPKMGAVKLIASPAKFYTKLGKIKIGKQEYLTPGPIDEYLNFTYFNNWQDKTDRRHGDTYNEMHAKEFVEDVNKSNEAIVWKNKQ